MTPIKTATFALLALLLAACGIPQEYPKQRMGTLLGAAGGAYAGAHFGKGKGRLVATALGTLLGASIGGDIGRSLDRADILYMQRAGHQALEFAPSGATGAWRNPNTGNGGTITPLGAYLTNSGRSCREFRMTVTIGGRLDEAYGIACRSADGTWRLARS